MSIAFGITKSLVQSPDNTVDSTNVLARITPALYADLRRLARCFMRGERGGHTLQPTAVVHEALLRLSSADLRLADREHLFRIVAQTMRRVLVDHARERRRQKRNSPEVDFEPATEPIEPYVSDTATPLDVLDIDAALHELSREVPRAAVLLELRYFAGLDDCEIGELYGMSRPTVEREFRFAKAFLVTYANRHRTDQEFP